MHIILHRAVNKLMSLLYMPICRAYARHLGDKPADSLLRFLCGLQFLQTYHYYPNFVQPRTFPEKVWSRQLHQRNPIFTMISDKFRVREYVAAKAGSSYLVPLLWNGDKPAEIPFDSLPQEFVIKMNHGCEYNIIVHDKTQLHRQETIFQLEKWKAENFCTDTFLGIPWAYKNIKPHITIETFLDDNGQVPVDYKFFCFSGRMEFFKIDFARFDDHSTKYFDRALNELDLVEVGFKQYQGEIALPDNFNDMVLIAESLAQEFDFIRVDLYHVKNRIYFGELTLYPGGISQKLYPNRFDYIFGEKWEWK